MLQRPLETVSGHAFHPGMQGHDGRSAGGFLDAAQGGCLVQPVRRQPLHQLVAGEPEPQHLGPIDLEDDAPPPRWAGASHATGPGPGGPSGSGRASKRTRRQMTAGKGTEMPDGFTPQRDGVWLAAVD
jgi:hypothetical protein